MAKVASNKLTVRELGNLALQERMYELYQMLARDVM